MSRRNHQELGQAFRDGNIKNLGCEALGLLQEACDSMNLKNDRLQVWEATRLLAPEELVPISQSLITSELASAFNLIPESATTFADEEVDTLLTLRNRGNSSSSLDVHPIKFLQEKLNSPLPSGIDDGARNGLPTSGIDIGARNGLPTSGIDNGLAGNCAGEENLNLLPSPRLENGAGNGLPTSAGEVASLLSLLSQRNSNSSLNLLPISSSQENFHLPGSSRLQNGAGNGLLTSTGEVETLLALRTHGNSNSSLDLSSLQENFILPGSCRLENGAENNVPTSAGEIETLFALRRQGNSSSSLDLHPTSSLHENFLLPGSSRLENEAGNGVPTSAGEVETFLALRSQGTSSSSLDLHPASYLQENFHLPGSSRLENGSKNGLPISAGPVETLFALRNQGTSSSSLDLLPTSSLQENFLFPGSSRLENGPGNGVSSLNFSYCDQFAKEWNLGGGAWNQGTNPISLFQNGYGEKMHNPNCMAYPPWERRLEDSYGRGIGGADSSDCGGGSSEKRPRKCFDMEFEDADSCTYFGEPAARTLKRPRLVWTPQLHKRFVDAVAHLGIKNAVPKNIMQLMNVDSLTRENVASHLQKYRLYLKRMQGFSQEGPSVSDHLFASTPVPPSLTGSSHFLSHHREDISPLLMPLPRSGVGLSHMVAPLAPSPTYSSFDHMYNALARSSAQRLPPGHQGYVTDIRGQPASPERRVLTLFPTSGH